MSRFIDPFRPAARTGDRGRSSTPAGQSTPTPPPTGGAPRDPERMTKADLVVWARHLGLSTAGTKPELVARIRGSV